MNNVDETAQFLSDRGIQYTRDGDQIVLIDQFPEEALGFLSLHGFKLTRIPDFSMVVNLRSLSLIGNAIVDYLPIASLTSLTDIHLSGCRIRELEELVDILMKLPNLIRIDLNLNEIEDLSPLIKLQQLVHLEIDSNFYKDISPLAQLPNLMHLDISSNLHTIDESIMSIDELDKALPDGCESYC